MPATIKAALLGILQGVTEFLPVSSTAHLRLGERLLGYEDPDGVFTVLIQLGSILAIMLLYRHKIIDIIGGLRSRYEARHFTLAIVVATIPALLAGALLSGFVKRVLYGSPAVFASAFIAGGLVMLVVERVRPSPVVQDAEHTPVSRALVIGVCQTLALIPGVSRSGSTIVGAMAVGLDRAAAAEFSFFLAMPTMTAAFAHDLFEVRHQLSADRALEIGIGFVAAFLASLVVVTPFLLFVRRSGFDSFAWYRIGLGVVIFAAIAAGWL
jgi:undecaprenyl-diphosphatase